MKILLLLFALSDPATEADGLCLTPTVNIEDSICLLPDVLLLNPIKTTCDCNNCKCVKCKCKECKCIQCKGKPTPKVILPETQTQPIQSVQQPTYYENYQPRLFRFGGRCFGGR